jgi:hypothetical protein
VAVEHTGPDAARSFVAAAGITVPTIIDEQGTLSRLFAFWVRVGEPSALRPSCAQRNASSGSYNAHTQNQILCFFA